MPIQGGDFESWLDDSLNRALSAQAGPSPLATQASYHAAQLAGGIGMTFGSTVVSALTSKLAVGAATAVVIVGGGTAAAATAGSGSVNPSDWGQYISQTVVPTCKAQAASAGLHGIGQCVASIARLHGQEVASAARHHGAGEAALHGRASDARGREESAEGGKNGAENGKPPSQPGAGNSDGAPKGTGSSSKSGSGHPEPHR